MLVVIMPNTLPPGVGVGSLYGDLRSLQAEVWRFLDITDYTGVGAGEETITDIALNCLKLIIPDARVRVRKFTKREEGKNGADWEWWFTEGGQFWGMRVQAKLLSPVALRYKKLKSKIGRGPKLQISALLQAAAHPKFPLYPAYGFFNYWDVKRDRDLKFGCHGQSAQQQWEVGCTLADAWGVRRLIRGTLNKSTLSDLRPISIPWSCLDCSSASLSQSLPERVRGSISRAFYAPQFSRGSLGPPVTAATRASADSSASTPEPNPAPPYERAGARKRLPAVPGRPAAPPPVLHEAPDYVRELLERREPFEDEAVHPAGVDAVVVVDGNVIRHSS